MIQTLTYWFPSLPFKEGDHCADAIVRLHGVERFVQLPYCRTTDWKFTESVREQHAASTTRKYLAVHILMMCVHFPCGLSDDERLRGGSCCAVFLSF